VDHPLNPLAGKLAIIALQDVGVRMKKCWQNNDAIDNLILYIRDTYFVHPNDTDWMDDTIKNWAKKNEKALLIAESETEIYHHEKQFKKNLEKFEKEIENIKNSPKNN